MRLNNFWILQSQHQIPGWEMRQHCSTPTPAQALGLTPLPDHGNPTDALEASMALHSRAECAGAYLPQENALRVCMSDPPALPQTMS